MKNSKMVILMMFAMVLLIAGMAFAQRHGRMSCEERFDTLNTSHDGKLTLEQLMAAPHHRGNPEERFKAMDVNGHGYITKEEFCSGRGGSRHDKGDGMDQGQGTRTSQ
jgi:Ca2+-binding EF-hand superfamily protein